MSRRIIALLFALTAILSVTGTALAADPPTLSGVVNDSTGRLAGGEARVQAAADALKTERDIDYYVIFMQGIDGENPATFVERTAAANGLSDKKAAILLVSLDDRQIALWSSGQNSITNSELDAIRENEVVPKLRAGDFVGATEVAATGLARADVAAAPAPAAPAPQQPAPQPINIDWTPIAQGLLGLIFLGVLAVVIFEAARRVNRVIQRRREEREVITTMRTLADDARTTLLDADEAIRDAEQELAFAEAEFGAETLTTFRATLATAHEELTSAYAIAQEIDDDKPETTDERRSMFRRVTTKAEAVTGSLSKQKEYLTGLRRDEQTVVDSVKQMTLDSKIRARALQVATDTLARLQAHGQSAYESVANSIEVARAKFAQADSLLAQAQERIDSGQRAKATLSLRDATEAIAAGKSNLDSISKVGETLADAEARLDGEIATAQAEIASAAEMSKKKSVTGVSQFINEARKALKTATTEQAKPDADFLVAYEAAVRANVEADKALDGVRDEENRRRRLREAAEAQVRQARVAIEQADAYIKSHRDTVGRKARTRLSEARRKYDESQSSGLDMFQAAAIAVIATGDANEAYATARSEVTEAAEAASSVSSYSRSSSYSSSGYGSSSSSSSYESSRRSSSSSSSFGSDSFSIGSFGGSSSGGSFGGGGGGGSSSGGGW